MKISQMQNYRIQLKNIDQLSLSLVCQIQYYNLQK